MAEVVTAAFAGVLGSASSGREWEFFGSLAVPKALSRPPNKLLFAVSARRKR
jgi:hypothetical protein